ncbi:protein translocase subunit SecF [Candidatus Parcubacteria bacterium]|nr:MAG: protein translocase subunit SecF [Candidatus Parcubacteria bacterium]
MKNINIIGNKNLYFIISAIVIVPGLISLFLFGLNLSIDFTGGSRIEYQISNIKDQKEFNKVINDQNVNLVSVKKSSNNLYTLRTNIIDQKKYKQITESIKKKYGNVKELSFETVGPVIGSETKNNALKAVLVASVVITLYIAFVFRQVSKPVASWKFGIAAIIALLHDILIVIGIFSLLGHFFKVEVDSLFITALLTVMGFSVHDTIVVFDRIRENLKKNISFSFEEVVNNSILETFNRSLNTSLTVALVLVSLIVFGGESIRWFIAALLIGIISGTYSSIFSASPILVVWHEFDKKRNKA